MILSTDEALRQVWDHTDDRYTALALAIEVINLRERIVTMQQNEADMAGVINRLYDELEAVL